MKRDYHFSAETTLTVMGVNGTAIIIKSKSSTFPRVMVSISYGWECKQVHVYSIIKLNRSGKE